MGALSDAAAVAVTFSLVGIPIVRVLLGKLRWYNLLLAPSSGLAFLIICLTLLSLLGFPMVTIVPTVVIIAAIPGAILMVLYPRSILTLAVFGFCFSLLEVAYLVVPLVKFDHDWIGFAHVDPTRFMLFGLYLQHDSLKNAHVSQPGLPFAIVQALLKLSPAEALMPTMFGIFFAILCATAAMAISERKIWHHALGAAAIMGTAAMALWGVYLGNVGHEEGLAYTCALVATGQKLFSSPKRWSIRKSIFVSLLLAAIFEEYEAYIPFVGLLMIFALFVLSVQNRSKLPILFRSSAAILLITTALLNIYLPRLVDATRLLLEVAHLDAPAGGHAQIEEASYLLPSAIPGYWGIVPAGQIPADPLGSLAILAGIVLSSFLVLLAVRLSARRFLPSMMCLVMFLFAMYSFSHRATYELLKMTEFSQPFTAVTLIIGLRLVQRRLFPKFNASALPSFLIMGVFIAASLPGSLRFLDKTGDRFNDPSQAYVLIRHAAASHLVTKVAEFSSQAVDRVLVTESADEPTVNYELSSVFGRRFMSPGQKRINTGANQFVLPDRWESASFNLTPGAGKIEDVFDNDVSLPMALRNPNLRLLRIPAINSFFNGLANNADWNQPSVDSFAKVRNFLIFENSSLGSTGDVTNPGTSLYEAQGDFSSKRSFVEVGRYLLFLLINPSPSIRVLLTLTDSPADEDKTLPLNAKIVGTSVGRFHFLGRGSGRMLSDVVEPVVIGGNSYIAIDMGRAPMYRKPEHRTGLMRLYGTNIRLDNAGFTAYVRDVSALDGSRSFSTQCDIPAYISFSNDLMNRCLAYSGLYEDGWMANESEWYLRAAAATTHLSLELERPESSKPAPMTCTVTVDDQMPKTFSVSVGENDISFGHFPRGVHRIMLRASRTDPLPNGDGREASVHLLSLGFN